MLRFVPIATILSLAVIQLILILAFPLRTDAVLPFFDATANRILSGEVPYIDFFSVALPAKMYLHVPAAALGHWLGVNGVSVWLLLTWLQLVASLAICWHLGRKAYGRQASPSFQLIPALSLAGISFHAYMTYSYGMREHIFVIYAVPWLLMRFCTWEGGRFRVLPGFLFGALAGIATAIKPYFFLVIVGVECYWLLRYRRIRPLLAIEVFGFLSANAIYLGLIVASPEVFQGVVDMIEQSMAYQYIREPSLPDEISRVTFVIPFLIGVMALCLSAFTRRFACRLLGALGIFTILGGAIIVLQHGSHEYRYVVLYTGAASCAGLLFLLLTRAWRGESVERHAGVALNSFILLCCCYTAVAQWHHLDYVRVKTPIALRALVEPITDPGDEVLFLTGQLGYVYPWFGLEGLIQTSGMIDAWVLPLKEDSKLAEKSLALYAQLTRRDIDASPSLVIVDKKSAHKARVPKFLRQFGLVESLQSRYSLVGETSRFDVYQYVGVPPPQTVTFEFTDRFTLYSWEVEARGVCETLDLRTWWRPGIAPDLEVYTLHVDLVSKETGAPLVEGLGRIGGVGVYSDRFSLLDVQQVELPCAGAAGTVMLLLSLEDMSVTGGRLLPVRDSRGADYGNYVYLGEFSLDADKKL